MAKRQTTTEPAAEDMATQSDQTSPDTTEPAAEDMSHMVAVTKGGETLFVHPSCVKAHQSAGWKVAE